MKKISRAAFFLVPLCLVLGACSGPGRETEAGGGQEASQAVDISEYLRLVDADPQTLDPQCTNGYYTVPMNVFDTLVQVSAQGDTSDIVPSLADSWEISPDGLEYTFHLHPGVHFQNGEALTSSDVGYTFSRLLTYPHSVHGEVAGKIRGADALAAGETDTLEGFEVLSDTDFRITLVEPISAFLAQLSTPGASILDETTTESLGEDFGSGPETTIGTGPFFVTQWNPSSDLVMQANKDCWSGAPACEGIVLNFLSDGEQERLLFEKGEMDIIDLENMGSEAEYFYRGDLYAKNLVSGPRVGISYIALNASIKPLDDVRVRRALQISLRRQSLLDAVYSGRGNLEQGIFPHGLIGFNPDLPEIPYDLERAKELLAEAGYPDGFELGVAFEKTPTNVDLMTLVAAMWEKIGVHATLEPLDTDEFLRRRRVSAIPCYCATWSADYNDPENFIYTFFGNETNTAGRSLCYADKDVMERVSSARAIVDTQERIKEYQALEEKIIQEDASWIPLFSIEHGFVVQDWVEGFKVSWNGWSSNCYRDVAKSK